MNKEFGDLSAPIIYGGDTLMDRIENGMSHFRSIFLNEDIKPRLYGKRIYFEISKVYKRSFALPLPERYLHIVSLDNADKFTVYPCNNEYASYSICQNLCEEPSQIPCFQLLDRWECPYRLSRIHWIPEIIRLANEGNECIKFWEKEVKDKTASKKYLKYYLRYTYGFTDYVIIFRNDSGSEFVFISAYPVCSRKAKKDFDKDYAAYVQKTKEPKV